MQLQEIKLGPATPTSQSNSDSSPPPTNMSTPILLLKTKSSPHDGYDDYFSANHYTPAFIPVLEHRFHTSNLAHIHSLFTSGAFTSTSDHGPQYGGIIFTSQRAVEGFAQILDQHTRTSSYHPSQYILNLLPSPKPPNHPPLHSRSGNSPIPKHSPRQTPSIMHNPRRRNRNRREPSPLHTSTLSYHPP